MVLFNYSTRELTAKIVYYGPGLCGKTTNLQYVHANLPENVRGKMLSLATKTDRTLFFDFLPIDLGDIRGMKTRVQLYTVPGQVFYNETRKLVLKGADGIVFVADSQEAMMGANVESFRNLEENLRGHGMRLQDMPHVLQFNKRDLPRLSSIEDLNTAINKYNAPFYESVATTGIGVQDTLKAVVKLVLLYLTRKYEPEARGASASPGRTTAGSVPRAVPVPVAVASPPTPPRPVPPPAAFPVAAPTPGAGRPRDVRSVPVSSFSTPLENLSSAIEEGRPSEISSPPLPASAVASGEDVRADMNFGDDEIDRLVDEVEETEGIAAAPATDDVDWSAVAERAAPEADPAEDAGAPVAEEIPLEAPGDGEDSLEEPAWAAPSSAPVEPLAAAPEVAVEWSVAQSPEEIADSRPPSPPEPADLPGAAFEVDLGFDPAFAEERESSGERHAVPAHETVNADLLEPVEPEAPPHEEALGSVPVGPGDLRDEEPADVPVVLRDVARPEDLFHDPSLEIARLEAGEAREIVVPVEIGRPPDVQRFRLSISLRLDRLD